MPAIPLTPDQYSALRRLYNTVENADARAALEATLRAASPFRTGHYYELTNHDGWTSVAYWDGEHFLNEWDESGESAVTDLADVASAVRLVVMPKPSTEILTLVARSKFEAYMLEATPETRDRAAKVWNFDEASEVRWRDLPEDSRWSLLEETKEYYLAIRDALDIVEDEGASPLT